MSEGRREPLDQPRDPRRRTLRLPRPDPEVFGGIAERFARWMGTAQFLIYMSVFVVTGPIAVMYSRRTSVNPSPNDVGCAASSSCR